MQSQFFRARHTLPRCVMALIALASASAAERRASFNQGWRFHKGDAASAEQPGFNDAGWRTLDLPHDWAIEGAFDSKYNPETGGLPIFGVAWYRKHFIVPADTRGKF